MLTETRKVGDRHDKKAVRQDHSAKTAVRQGRSTVSLDQLADKAHALIITGDALFDQDDREAALGEYRKSLSIRETLADAVPDNADWQRDLSDSHDKIGHVLFAQGEHEAALSEFRKSFGICKTLAAADPGNADWQHALLGRHIDIGRALRAAGDHDGALTEYRQAFVIAKRLTTADPDHVEWQRDLYISHSAIGRALLAQGDRAGAITECLEAFLIAERLTAADPNHALWKRDLTSIRNDIIEISVRNVDIGESNKPVDLGYRASDPANTMDKAAAKAAAAAILSKAFLIEHIEKAFEHLEDLAAGGVNAATDSRPIEKLRPEAAASETTARKRGSRVSAPAKSSPRPPDLTTARMMAAYEVLVRDSDLTNPALVEDERLRRATRLLKTYNRLRKYDPDFHDSNDQLRAARRIERAHSRLNKKAKLQAGEAAHI